MSKSSRVFLSFLAGVVLFLSIPALAKADSLTPIFLDAIPDGANTRFNYNVQYTAAGGALQSGDFVTFYDVPGLVSIINSGVWSASSPFSGLTPPGVSPTDDPAIRNVVFTYTGPTLNTSLLFVSFTIISTFRSTQTGTFADQTHGATGALVGQLGTVTIPSATSSVPEPATMLLLGSGLAGIAVKVRKRRKGI